MEDATFSFSVAEKYYNAMAKKITGDYKGIIESESQKIKTLEKEYKELLKDDTKGGELKKIENKKQKSLDFIKTERTSYLEKIKKVIADLEALVKLLPSSERFNILGSTYKRNAFILESNKQEAFKMAALNYQKAYSFSNNWYSLTNWLALESTLVMTGSHFWGLSEDNNKIRLEYKLPSTDEAIRLLDASKESLCVNTERMSYWDMLAGINIGLCKYILQYSDKSDKKEFENIYREISELWKKAGSKGKRFAEIEHLEFVIDAFSETKNKNAIELKTKLEQLLKDLTKQL